jgi:RNA polymerase sigma-70 factor (ECF subfamily)
MANEREQEKAIDLMIAYQSGSLEAFESLYRILYPTLLRYLMYQTFDRSRAEDLLQESFLQLHRSRRSYMPGRPVLPWALAIARNVWRMDRRARRRRESHETVAETGLPEIPTIGELDRMAERESLRRALAQLPPEQREILMMHHFLGLSFHEIAGILGIRRGAAKLRAHRAVKNLRTLLAVPMKPNECLKQSVE